MAATVYISMEQGILFIWLIGWVRPEPIWNPWWRCWRRFQLGAGDMIALQYLVQTFNRCLWCLWSRWFVARWCARTGRSIVLFRWSVMLIVIFLFLTSAARLERNCTNPNLTFIPRIEIIFKILAMATNKIKNHNLTKNARSNFVSDYWYILW